MSEIRITEKDGITTVSNETDAVKVMKSDTNPPLIHWQSGVWGSIARAQDFKALLLKAIRIAEQIERERTSELFSKHTERVEQGPADGQETGERRA